MENKYIAGIIVGFLAVVVGLALYSGSFSDNIGQMTKTFTVTNTSFTLPANGSTSEISACGQRVISITVVNATSGVTVSSTNYTTSQRVSTGDGYLVSTITTVSAGISPYAGQAVKATCNYAPRGYIEDAGSRGIVALIAVFMALLIVVSASPDLRDWLKNF